VNVPMLIDWQKPTSQLSHFGWFAATVGAEKSKYLATFDAKAHVVKRREIAETAREIFGLNSVFIKAGARSERSASSI
jgi:hypothetical protein